MFACIVISLDSGVLMCLKSASANNINGKNGKNDAGPQILFAAVSPEKTRSDSFRNNELILAAYCCLYMKMRLLATIRKNFGSSLDSEGKVK